MVEFFHRYVPGRSGSPVLLLLHGTGGSENDLLDLGKNFLPDAALLSPRGKILENGMPRFFRRLAEGVFDEEDLIFRTHELANFITEFLAAKNLVGTPVVAVGYSNGANIAASLLLLRPEILQGAVLLRAMVPLVPTPPPDLNGKKIFIASGESDRMIPSASASELGEMLRNAGAEVEHHWTAGGHELYSGELAEIRQLMQTAFPSKSAGI